VDPTAGLDGCGKSRQSHNAVYIDTILHLLVRTTSAKFCVIVRSPTWSSKMLLLSMLSPKSRLRLKFHRRRRLTVLKASYVLH